jgi:hypothetical protein
LNGFVLLNIFFLHFLGERFCDQRRDVRTLDEGDGRLLLVQDEGLHRPQDRTGGEGGVRLRGVHQDSFPEWNLLRDGISIIILSEFFSLHIKFKVLTFLLVIAITPKIIIIIIT